MKRSPLLAAAVATLLLGSTAALAQHDRHYRDYRGGHGGYGGYGWSGSAPRYYSPYHSPYYFPYRVYGSPYYVAPYYPFAVYAPAPQVYVERYFIEEAPPAPPPQRSYSDVP